MSNGHLEHKETEHYKQWQQEIGNDITDIRNGNKQAFNRLYFHTEQYVYYCIMKHGVPEEAATDIMQKVYMAIYENLGTLQDVDAAISWIKSIAYHKSMDYFRSEKKEKIITGQMEMIDSFRLEDTIRLPEDILESKTMQGMIRNMVDSLPEDYKQVIIAYYFDECKIDEIAETLGISPNTVKTRLSRARKRLQTSIERMEKEQGIRLHSVSAAPVLLLLFHLEAEATAVPFGVSEAVGAFMGQFLGRLPQLSAGVIGSEVVSQGVGTVGAAGTTGAVGMAGAKVAGIAVKKLAIGIVASLLAGGVIVYMVKNNDETVNTTTTEQVTETETDSPLSTETEEPPKTEKTTEITTTEADGPLSTEPAEPMQIEQMAGTVTTEEITTTEAVTVDLERQTKLRRCYHDIYHRMCTTYQWPDGTDLYISTDIMEALQYTVYDFDKDGYEELAVSVVTADNMASRQEKLYKCNPDTGEITCMLTIYPGAAYYDNQTAWGPSDNSHRYGKDLFKYNAASGIYERQAYVFKWTRDEWGEQYGDDLLEDVDGDGDGIVYCFVSPDSNVSYLEQDEYDAWYQQQIGAAGRLEIPWILFSNGWQYE
ncbi:MAG: sigma-70 family RNA polymerase sigma factor [Clostridium sp.]|nr:sigma-70 family RNA polymerase sigma factor [Clostridium sp.]MCM1398456.1 sigma-70 family RNA polymerase sigma factor [Clostridium sp.]MCM1460178.1 sigma-70 family RNA polymerase sigma factor [Bacteroides sp.]